MEEAQKYRAQFLDIAGEIELNLSLILEEWDAFLRKKDEMDDLYRMIHSLKSGAAFLDMAELEEKAHRAEGEVDVCRKGSGDGKILFDLLSEILDLLAEKEVAPLGNEVFTARETMIIDRARKRGESVYRILCRIDPAEPMKKARAFLIQNNLEYSFNVIKTVPSLDRDEDFSLFTLYLTTDERKDAVRRAMDVDRITEIRIEPYLPGDEEEGDGGEALTVLHEVRRHPVSVEMDRLDEIRYYLEEMSRGDGEKLADLVGGINRVMTSLVYEPFRSLGTGAELYLMKLADREGKRVDFEMRGGDMMLSLSWIQPLTEIFQQLIRNSLTHGIEREGKITLAGEEGDGRRVIRFSDNGRGLDLEKIRAASREGESLLDTICRSGFSTSPVADTMSGRGIGLNLVRHNAETIGAELSLEHYEDGSGLSFLIELPDQDVLPILQYRIENTIATVPRYFIEKELELNKRLLKRNRRNRYFYLHEGVHLPLFEGDRPVAGLDSMRRAQFVIILSYLTKRYALLADELLLESRVSRRELEQLHYIDPAKLEERVDKRR